MGYESSGARCDVCDNFILPLRSIMGLKETEFIHPFKLDCVEKDLICCNKCKEIIQNANGDWEKLPDGALKKAFKIADELGFFSISLGCN